MGGGSPVTLFFANTTDANAKETEDEVYLVQVSADWWKGEENGGQEDENEWRTKLEKESSSLK